MNTSKKGRPMSMSKTGLTFPLFLCSLLILLAGSGSGLLTAQYSGAFQPTSGTLIRDARFIEETNGSSANLNPLRSEAHNTQSLDVETAAEPLTCNGSPVAFEGGIPSDWSVENWKDPVYWSTTNDLSACNNGGNQTLGSGNAACADSDETNTGGAAYDTELFSNSFDLTGVVVSKLQFAVSYNDVGRADLFEVWVWDQSIGSMAFQWNSDHNEIKEIDLSSYIGKADVKVSFRYYGDTWDWWAQVDDVQLTCVIPPPDIDVDPLAIGSTQESGSVTNLPLDISNVGTADLDWSITEDSALAVDICDTPADIPWVSVKPGSGTTASSTTQTVKLTFDATGLAPGTYDGVLCVNSNDPDPGPGNNTDRVIVVLELIVEAAPDIDVDPIFIGSTQESGSETNHPLDISNVGTAVLDWFIEEDSALVADVCDTPADIPWVSVTPDSGTTAPGATEVLDVTFDATGLTPGTYSGLLCVNSNDPDPGPGNGTERVIVDLEMVVEAAPEPDIFVDPLFIGSRQETGSVTAHTLDIENVGTADLLWEIVEDNSVSSRCESPTAIPWLDVSPANGTTKPGESNKVVVTFDSTGSAPGTYSASLCVQSNDPDSGPGNGTKLVIVAVDMVVSPKPPSTIYLPVVQKMPS